MKEITMLTPSIIMVIFIMIIMIIGIIIIAIPKPITIRMNMIILSKIIMNN